MSAFTNFNNIVAVKSLKFLAFGCLKDLMKHCSLHKKEALVTFTGKTWILVQSVFKVGPQL